MNHKGQTLIIFVIMLPLFLILAAIVIDIGLLTNEQLKLSGITNTILEEYYEKQEIELEKEIKEYYKKNKIPTENLKVIREQNKLMISNEYEIPSQFGKLIGIKNYLVSIHKSITKTEKGYQIQKE